MVRNVFYNNKTAKTDSSFKIINFNIICGPLGCFEVSMHCFYSF